MPKHYTSVDGLFGQKIHYDENGNYAGESWPGLFEGSMEHYDVNGQYAGYSAIQVSSPIMYITMPMVSMSVKPGQD